MDTRRVVASTAQTSGAPDAPARAAPGDPAGVYERIPHYGRAFYEVGVRPDDLQIDVVYGYGL
jgi:hypothetical protein